MWIRLNYKKSKIKIPQTIILNSNKELLWLNNISIGNEVSCTNGKSKKISKKLDNKMNHSFYCNYRNIEK